MHFITKSAEGLKVTRIKKSLQETKKLEPDPYDWLGFFLLTTVIIPELVNFSCFLARHKVKMEVKFIQPNKTPFSSYKLSLVIATIHH